MSGRWNHAMCGFCWYMQRGPRFPVRVKDADVEMCCFCGTLTKSGIFNRADPETEGLLCDAGRKHEDGTQG